MNCGSDNMHEETDIKCGADTLVRCLSLCVSNAQVVMSSLL
jgi:hypothetical protein